MQKLSTDYLKSHMEYVRKNGVSYDPNNGIQHTLDFQDAIGRSTNKELFDTYQELDQTDRKTFIFAACASLSVDLAESVLKASFMATMRNDLYDEFDRAIETRETELHRKTQVLEDGKKAIYKRIREQRKTIERLTARNADLEKHNAFLTSYAKDIRIKNQDLSANSKKYTQIKALLA